MTARTEKSRGWAGRLVVLAALPVAAWMGLGGTTSPAAEHPVPASADTAVVGPIDLLEPAKQCEPIAVGAQNQSRATPAGAVGGFDFASGLTLPGDVTPARTMLPGPAMDSLHPATNGAQYCPIDRSPPAIRR
jgi:hypothetical protein